MPAEFAAEERELAQERDQEQGTEEVQDAAQPEEPTPDPNTELREIVAQQSQQIKSLTDQITRLIQGGAQVRGTEAKPRQQQPQPTYERFSADPYKDVKPLEEMDFSI